MASLNDPALDEMLEVERDIQNQLVALLSELPFVSPHEQLRLIQKIRVLLRQLRDELDSWALAHFATYAESEEERLVPPVLLVLASAAVRDYLVQKAVQRLRDAVGEAERAIQALARRLSRPSSVASIVGAVGRRAAESGNTALLRQALRERLSKGFVEVLGANSRTYRYSLDYWLSLQSFMARQLLSRDLVIARTSTGGSDLVQISNEPSSIGDYCDLYRGKVFSISGTHPFYLPLSLVPNGGAPMHIWCRHTMTPYVGEKLVSESVDIPEGFLDLGAQSASSNEFLKMWRSHGR